MKLFEIMVAKREPMTIEQLAKETESDPAFLGDFISQLQVLSLLTKALVRLLRYLASVRMIRETGKNTFEANNVTEALSQKGYKGGVGH